VERVNWTQEGWADLEPAKALDCLEPLLATGTSGAVAVVAADWKKFAHHRPQRGPFVSELLVRTNEDPSWRTGARAEEANWLYEQLARLPPPERLSYLREHVAQEVRQALGLPLEQALDPVRGFAELGMSSMMAVNLRNRLQAALGHELPATLAYTYPTVEQLAEQLFRLVYDSRTGLAAVAGSDRATADLGIDDMSDQEIAQIIARKHETLCC
jgi:acyl carrier protein